MAWYDTKVANVSTVASSDWNAQADVVSSHGYITVAQAEPANYVGSTHVAIQAAIDDAESSGKRILIKKGTYTISSTLTVNGHVHIYGEGQEQTILSAANSLNANMLEVNSTKTAATHWRCNFQDLKFSGNMANQTSGSCVVAHGMIQSTFFRCHFENFYNYGLHLWDCQGGSGAYGHHNQVIDCLFDQGESSGGEGIGIYMRNNDENTIIACQLQYNKIGIKDETGFNQITSCAFVDGQKGVYILNASRTRVNSCVFDYCAHEGVWLKGAFNIVDGCTFYRCSDGSTTYDCLLIDYFGSNTITNNVFLAQNSSQKANSAIKEAGSAGEDTYGHNLIANNYFASISDATTLQGSSNWATAALIQANTNDTSNNVTRTS